MDHREEVQQEAEQWQEKSAKLIQRIRWGVLIFGIAAVLILFVRNLGFPREVNETIPAIVITEDGQTLECTVEIRGEVTNYPLNKSKFGMDDQVTIYANGNRMLLVSFHGDRSTGFICTQNQNAVCVMTVQRDALIMETDLQIIFPEMESRRCLISYGYDSFDLTGEYAELFTFFSNE